MAAIHLMASGATIITERLRKRPRRLSEARNDLRIIRTSLLSLRPFAHFEVSSSARGPEKRIKDIKMTTSRAKEYISLASYLLSSN
jgi:hypothetical protein